MVARTWKRQSCSCCTDPEADEGILEGRTVRGREVVFGIDAEQDAPADAYAEQLRRHPGEPFCVRLLAFYQDRLAGLEETRRGWAPNDHR